MATICTTTTLNCPTEVLIPWVSYHLNMGVDHMFLFFDDPNHPGIGAVERDCRITAIRCDAAYWPGGAAKRERLTLHQRQWYNANKALGWARERGFDWIAHIDSDELIYYPGRLQQALVGLSEDIEVVRFRVYEAVPEELHSAHPFAGIRYFRVGPMRPTRKTWPRSLRDWTRAVAHLSSYYGRLLVAKAFCSAARGPYLRGHTGGKSAVRTAAPIAGMGVHVPAPPPGHSYRDYFLPHAAVLHYDCSDFESWLAKWRGRAEEKRVPRNRDEKRRRQLARFSQALQAGDIRALQDLYRRDYFVVPASCLKFLKCLGLIADIPALANANMWSATRFGGAGTCK